MGYACKTDSLINSLTCFSPFPCCYGGRAGVRGIDHPLSLILHKKLYKLLVQVTCIVYSVIMMNDQHEQDSRSIRLAIVIKRLRTSLQEAALAGATGLSLSQVLILRRLRVEGPLTAASLAAAEQVTHQAVTQNLSELKRAGLVETAPDPDDGRKKLISITEAGKALSLSVHASRNAWLAHVIESTISESELSALDKAIELLERLAAPSNSEKPR